MSYDRQIDQQCPHVVLEEMLLVLEDLRTVRPMRPVSSIDSVRVRLNGALEVPSSGVHVAAQVRGLKRGPYSIQASNNKLALSVCGEAIQEVTLPSVSRIAADKLSDMLNKSVKGVTFYAVNDYLGFRSNLLGRDATIFISDATTLGPTLGIHTNREYRGVMAAPGWTLIRDRYTLDDRPARLIIFDEPLKAGINHVELDYATVKQECRRCGGVGFENDWRYSRDGNVVTVQEEALFIQEGLKIFYTAQGSNPFHPWYGTQLFDRISTKIASTGLVQTLITSDIQQAFRRWQNLKMQQETIVGQFVSDREYPFRLSSINVQQSQYDPTVLFLDIRAETRSGQPVVLERGVQLPASSALIGGPAVPGAIRQSLSDYTLSD